MGAEESRTVGGAPAVEEVEKPREAMPQHDSGELARLNSLSYEQVEEITRIARKHGDGNKLNRDQLDAVLKEVNASHPHEAFSQPGAVEWIFQLFDTDHSGGIDMSELISGISVFTKGSPEQKAELTFKAYDIDGNGFIDREEMKQIVRKSLDSSYKIAKQEVDKSKKDMQQSGADPMFVVMLEMSESMLGMINSPLVIEGLVDEAFKADTDGDNKISLSEWKEFARTNPKARTFLEACQEKPPSESGAVVAGGSSSDTTTTTTVTNSDGSTTTTTVTSSDGSGSIQMTVHVEGGDCKQQ